MNLIEGLRKEFKVSGHFVSILLLAVWSLVWIPNMFPLKFLGTQLYFAFSIGKELFNEKQEQEYPLSPLMRLFYSLFPSWK